MKTFSLFQVALCTLTLLQKLESRNRSTSTALGPARSLRVKTFRLQPVLHPHQSHDLESGRGYIGARTDITQQANICLDRHLQTRVAPFNQICLPWLLLKNSFSSQLAYCRWCATLHDVRSDNDWDDFLLMDSNLCLEFMKRRKRRMYELWESRTEGEYTIHNNAWLCFIYK
jgi:hypothetical protein